MTLIRQPDRAETDYLMHEQKNPPATDRGALEALGGTESILQDTSDTRLIGHTVERQVDSTLWLLVRGEIELHQLTPALAGLYHVGYMDGRAAMQPDLDRAIADRDRFYRKAYPSKAQELDRAWVQRMAESIELGADR